MSCVQSNRKSDFICMKFSTQLTRYLQSFIKFAQNVCFAFGKKDQKNTLSTCQKKTTTIYVFIFNKFNFQNCFLTFVGVCSSNSLASRRGTRNLIYILAFILLNFLTTSAYSTSTLLLLHLFYPLVQVQ